MDDNMRQLVDNLGKEMQCTCDLDKWQPTKETGHTCVCVIHKTAKIQYAIRVAKGSPISGVQQRGLA